MITGVVIVLFSVAFAWVIVSRKLSQHSVTAPIVLALAGWICTAGAHPLLEVDPDASVVRVAVEVTLALVLFVDASKVGFGSFRTRWRWPTQLLVIGLPLTIGAGYLAGAALLPDLPAANVALIAAALAPTDAALGAPVLDDERIPVSIRQTVNVESGLNDGLVTPFVLFFIQAAAGHHGGHPKFLVELTVAVAVGAAVGGLGGTIVHIADQRRWSLRDEEPIAATCLAMLAYFLAVEAHGNGFISAFVAGLVFGTRLAHRKTQEVLQLTHQLGVLLGFAVWLLFGAVLVPITLHALSWQLLCFAVLSITVVRMVPVAIASFGLRERRPAVALVGWLGPRGLASIVFAILAVEQLPASSSDPVVRAIAVTVALSVVCHGLSARSAATLYRRAVASADPNDLETDT